MHVRRLVIHRYGPLKPFEDDLSAFTLIHGPNERGKTLIVDALVRMLFKDDLKRPHYKLFGNLTRVDERPEGFLVIATHERETKIGADETLADVAPVAISPEDFRNVFLIRDSDLALSDEEAYYGRVSERLCGTRSTAIGRLKEALKHIGRLRSATPDSPLTIRRDRDQKRIGEQVAAAERLLDVMIQTGETLAREDFDVFYRRLADLADERERLEAEARRLRAAETRARLEKAREETRAAREELFALAAALSAARDERLAEWRALIVRREMLEKDLDDAGARGEALRAAREEARSAWESMRAAAAEKEALRELAAAELRPLVEDWTREHALRARVDHASRAVVAVLAASVVLGIASLVAALLTRSPIGVGAVFACALAASWCAASLWRNGRARTGLARREAAILTASTRLGLHVESAPEAAHALEALERDAAQALERAREAEIVVKQRESDVASSDEVVSERRAQILETRSAAEALRNASGFESVERLEEAVARRRALESRIDTRIGLLRGWIPAALHTPDREEYLRACDAAIDRALAGLPDGVTNDDPDAAARAEGDLERLTAEQNATRQRLERIRQDLGGIEVRIADLGALEGPVHCRTTRELSEAQRRLAEFCESVQRDARLAREAIRLLEEIEAEENEKVGALFGEGTLVSRWFREITEGRYRAVHLDEGEITLELPGGKRLLAEALSGGALDQLYLAIRASIAERMLPDSKGFFVLDDPFIKADRDRLRTLMKVLRHLVERGWQIIYVTAKDEVVDVLRADIAAGRVKLIELERSLFVRGAARVAPDVSDAPRLF